MSDPVRYIGIGPEWHPFLDKLSERNWPNVESYLKKQAIISHMSVLLEEEYPEVRLHILEQWVKDGKLRHVQLGLGDWGYALSLEGETS
jgi:hypothetical protein